MPYTVKALIGDRGIVAFFVLLFMALTSTVSSSMIAVSSILSFDLYKTYINPKASDKKLVRMSHLAVVVHGVFITAISIAMNYGGANLTWIGYFRPILSCPGIIPLAFTLCWSGQTRLAAILSPVLGFFTGLAIWLATAQSMYGAINLTTTGAGLPALYGAIGSFFSPALYSVVISLYKPYKFDWREFLRIELAEEAQLHASTTSTLNDTQDEAHSDSKAAAKSVHSIPETPPSETSELGDPESAAGTDEKSVAVFTAPSTQLRLDDVRHPFDDETLRELFRWSRIAWIIFVAIVLVTFILWPMPLYRNYVFTKPFFEGWTTVAIIWQFGAFFAVVLFPLYDGRHAIAKGSRGVWKSTREYLNKNKE
jgi:hypothetical protein